MYTTWSQDRADGSVHCNSGIVAAKAELNQLHQRLAKEGYTQVTSLYYTCVCVCVRACVRA